MKRRMGLPGCIALTVMLVAGNAFAQQSDGAGRLNRLFDQIDRDASGTLTAQEMRAAAAAQFNKLDLDGNGMVTARESRGSRLAMRFNLADTDRSGTLDLAEMQEVAKQRAGRRLVRLDRNGDGMLSLSELQDGRRDRLAQRSAEPKTMTLPELEAQMMAMFRRADADGDGIVTVREARNGANR